MIGTVLRRRRVITAAANHSAHVAPKAAPKVITRGWTNLQAEIVGEMRRLGADPLPVTEVTERYDGTRAGVGEEGTNG